MKTLSAILAFFSFTCLAAHCEARWADPRGFFDDETISEKLLRPGLRQISASGTRDGRPVRSHLIVADLSLPELRLEAFPGSRVLVAKSGQFVWRSTVSQMLADQDALAAINVAFFDIGSTQASQGLVIRDGRILREPQAARPSLLVAADGRVAIAEVGWQASVQAGARRRPLAGVNRPSLGKDEVVAYQLPWSRSPGSSAAFTRDQKVREIHVGPLTFHPASGPGQPARRSGPVIEIRSDGSPIELKNNHLVLSASESAAPFFRDVSVGQELSIEWSLENLPANLPFREVTQAVSAQPVLINEGKLVDGGGAFWTTRHPRSAVAIHPDGKQVILLVVDGRSTSSAGMALGTLGEYLLHLGAHQALNLDGGGSSAIGTRIDGKTLILNQPSDGRERPFPTGLGITARGESGRQGDAPLPTTPAPSGSP
jgi:hypothetical protein